MNLSGVWSKVVRDAQELLAPFGLATTPRSGEPPSTEDIEFLKDLAGEGSMDLVDPKRQQTLSDFEGGGRLAQWKRDAQPNVEANDEPEPEPGPWG